MKKIISALACLLAVLFALSGCSGFDIGKSILDTKAATEATTPEASSSAAAALTTSTASTEEDADDDDDDAAISAYLGKTIDKDGTYTLTGNINGQVLVIAKTVTLILNSVTINCTDGPGILGYYEGGKQNLTVELRGKSTVAGSTHGIQGKDNLIVTGSGSVDVSAVKDGLHGGDMLTINGGTVNVLKSYEGMEAPGIIINGGNITVRASDDGINAASDSKAVTPSIKITGGTLMIYANSDGIDSNGTLEITGGNVLVFINASRDGDATDVDNGGSILPSVYASVSVGAGTKIAVGDVWSGTIDEAATAMFVCVPGLVQGQSYTITANGSTLTTATATSTIQGMMMGGGMGGGNAWGGGRGGR
ncbi:MAG: carbohydrate-binding domain-containing protein [Oscillospiraceae bacterium]|jgi:hypothetical protein|nr:carbohydrate-binding domain-containing protein [Oscillospiraceae bacterium]